jgi:hypothetical protein
MTTTTIKNPSNPGSFDLHSVPALTDDSRFALGATSEGWNVGTRAEAAAFAFARLLEHRTEEAPPLTPSVKSVPLSWVGRTTDGTYVVVDRGVVSRIPTHETTRSGRFKKHQQRAGGLLDSAFLGEADARADELYGALKSFCEQHQPSGDVLRSLNDHVSLLILLRAGIVMHRAELPQLHLRR